MSTKRAVIYARISRDDEEESTKIANQLKRCRALCEARDWEIVDTKFDQSISAYSGKKRPGWEAILERMKSGDADVIVVWALDRITRSMLDLEHLILLAEEHGFGVACVNGDIDLTTETGQMIARILAAVARAEVQIKSRRQRLANEESALKGEAWKAGPRPFGYNEDRITEHPTEAKVFREAVVDVLNGWTLAAIARRWTDEGVEGNAMSQKNRGKWEGSTIRRLLLNPRYAGLRTYKGKVVGKAEWEGLITEETQAELRELLSDPARGTGSPTGRQPRTMLSGLAVCACGNTVRAGRSHDTSAYKCSKFCVYVPRERADWYIASVMAQFLSRGDIKVSDEEGLDEDEAAALQEEREELMKRQKFLARQMALGEISEEAWKAANTAVNVVLKNLDAEMPGADLPKTLEEDFKQFRGKDPKAVAEAFMAMPLEKQRIAIQTLLDITLVPGVAIGRNASKVPISRRVIAVRRDAA